MRMSFVQHACEHERYGPHAFDNLVGDTVPWNLEGAGGKVQVGTATVVSVVVADDGKSAEWTVEFTDREEQVHIDPKAVAAADDMFEMAFGWRPGGTPSWRPLYGPIVVPNDLIDTAKVVDPWSSRHQAGRPNRREQE